MNFNRLSLVLYSVSRGLGYVRNALGTVPIAILDVATNGSSIILSAAILPCFTQTGIVGSYHA